MNKVELTDKELYIIWTIACFFNAPVTNQLKYKLSGMIDSPDRERLSKKYDALIDSRIVEMGKWIEGCSRELNQLDEETN